MAPSGGRWRRDEAGNRAYRQHEDGGGGAHLKTVHDALIPVALSSNEETNQTLNCSSHDRIRQNPE